MNKKNTLKYVNTLGRVLPYLVIVRRFCRDDPCFLDPIGYLFMPQLEPPLLFLKRK